MTTLRNSEPPFVSLSTWGKQALRRSFSLRDLNIMVLGRFILRSLPFQIWGLLSLCQRILWPSILPYYFLVLIVVLLCFQNIDSAQWADGGCRWPLGVICKFLGLWDPQVGKHWCELLPKWASGHIKPTLHLWSLGTWFCYRRSSRCGSYPLASYP